MERDKVKSLFKLNLGCGLVAPDGRVNIDSSYNALLAKYPKARKLLSKFQVIPERLSEIPWPKNITILDVRKGLPYSDSSVMYIYSSHLSEHLPRAEARRLLKECYRVLVSGGVIRIIVPDLRACVEKYIEAFQKWNGNSQELPPAEIFLENIDMYDPGLMNQPFWIRVYKGVYDKNTHKWAYDEQSLAYFLKATGFRDICKRKYGESLIENVASLDLPERFEGSICLEAVK
jgi:predicted SAM-dependent methyltransferase